MTTSTIMSPDWFPQTHLTWRQVAPALADQFTVACRDLPGYGSSEAPRDVEAFSKRATAIPTLAIWQHPGDLTLPFDPQKVWQNWASDLRTAVLPGGHFLPEARPKEVTTAIRELLA